MASPSTPPSLTEGMVVADRYRLERRIGQGGMASVWVARHLALHTDVALKFIATSHKDPGLVARFEREAKAAASIKSPHVVSIIDHGLTDDGRPYIAMELLQGRDLGAHLDALGGTMGVRDVAWILWQASKGLGKAHAAGVVHRDLKPENLFLCDDEDGFHVKLLDFGIAKAESPVGQVGPHTDTGTLVGTPVYMSPEQALGKRGIDFRTDLYSLAVVVYRCLTGTVPFLREGVGELIVAISSADPERPSSFRSDVGLAIDAWYAKATHKTKEERYASARELAEAFVDACRADGVEGDLPAFRALDGRTPPPARISADTPLVSRTSDPAFSSAPTRISGAGSEVAPTRISGADPPVSKKEPTAAPPAASEAAPMQTLVGSSRSRPATAVPPPRTPLATLVLVAVAAAALAVGGTLLLGGHKPEPAAAAPSAPAVSSLPAAPQAPEHASATASAAAPAPPPSASAASAPGIASAAPSHAAPRRPAPTRANPGSTPDWGL